MKSLTLIISISFCVILLASAIQPKPDSTKYTEHTLGFVKQQLLAFSSSTEILLKAVNEIKESDSLSIVHAKVALMNSRARYKSIEFFLTYFFRSNSLVYNEPPVFEVEEPFFDYRSPTGFQVIEEILFSKNPFQQKEELIQHVNLLHSSASDIHAFLYNMKISDRQILESIRLGIIRVIALGITGFDAPELKTGISESGDALVAFRTVLEPLFEEKSAEADSVSFYLNSAIETIRKNTDFNSFDRLGFLMNCIFPFQRHLGSLIDQENLYLNTTGVLNYRSANLFSPDALFIDPEANPYNLPIFPTDSNAIHIAMHSLPGKAIIKLGEELFFEKALSGNSSRSCASCHEPEKYFTDNLPRARTLAGDTVVQRNTPSMLYLSYQYSQFWDGRAAGLVRQIGDVLKNPIEMNADFDSILYRLKNNEYYVSAFAKAFPGKEKDSVITIHNLEYAIAGFLKTLAPFSSPFDHFMAGDQQSLTAQQTRGFNLFMGKAECATCHFVPLFNGLLPPFYDMTELENLGVTRDTNFTHPVLDADSGRYATTPAKYYMRKFKTPGLRDIAETAPYMHNGAFPDLRSVIDFYNKGGGEGMGLDVPHQTLSSRQLELTDAEIDDIIAFLNSLTDTKSSVYKTLSKTRDQKK